MCNLLTLHSEQTTRDEWLLKKKNFRLIVEATFVAYVQWRVRDWVHDSFVGIKHDCWRRNSTFAVKSRHTGDDTTTSLQISPPAALFVQWLFFLLWKNLRYHPRTPQFFLPSLFLFFLLPRPSRTNALTPTQNRT